MLVEFTPEHGSKKSEDLENFFMDKFYRHYKVLGRTGLVRPKTKISGALFATSHVSGGSRERSLRVYQM